MYKSACIPADGKAYSLIVVLVVMVMIVVVCTSCWGVLLLLRMCSVVTWKSPFVVPWSVFMRLVLRATAERQRKCPRARDATYQTASSLSGQRN